MNVITVAQRLMKLTEVLAGKEIVITVSSVMTMLIDYIKVNNKYEIELEFKCGLTVKESL